jgi:hypothetical protein
VNIPIEIFLPLIGLCLAMGTLGIWKKIPLTMLIAGAIISFLAIQTDSIILGKIPITSTTSGSTTTYAFIDNEFTLDAWSKIFIGLIGSILMFVGAIQWKKEES